MHKNTVSATDAGRALPGLLSKISTGEGACYITDGNGRARAVLLDIDRYNAMMDALEDETGPSASDASSSSSGGSDAKARPKAGSADAKLAGAFLEAILKRRRHQA